MLYQLYESQRALLSPFAEFASASSKLYNHPLSLFTHTPMAQRVSAGLDLMHRLAKEYEKPEFNITSVSAHGVDFAVQQQEALKKPFCRLLRFKRFTEFFQSGVRLFGFRHKLNQFRRIDVPEFHLCKCVTAG